MLCHLHFATHNRFIFDVDDRTQQGGAELRCGAASDAAPLARDERSVSHNYSSPDFLLRRIVLLCNVRLCGAKRYCICMKRET